MQLSPKAERRAMVLPITATKILIVDDQEEVCWALSNVVRLAGFEPLLAASGEEALHHLRNQPDMVLLDVGLPDMNGFDVLAQIRAHNASIPVVMVTAHGKTDDAVRAIRAGAYDYVTKPFLNQDIVLTIRRALAEKSLKQQKRQSFSDAESSASLLNIMGRSTAIQKIQAEVERVAETSFSVLLLGESGTGKEVVARAIHAASPRANKPFVALDCGAIPPTLIENELFGHEKGAFTGAHQAQIGAFEMAAGGTLFLDEIGNLPLATQATLLRVLETQHIRKIGSTREQKIDFRLIAATNINLQATVRQRTFRDDLYYRLAEFMIQLPSLHERSEDIVFLARRFLTQANEELSKKVVGLSPDTETMLQNYAWPGNVRELRNQMRRATLLCNDPDGIITPDLFLALDSAEKPAKLQAITPIISDCLLPCDSSAFTISNTHLLFGGETASLKEITTRVTAQVERLVLMQVLQHTHGNKAEAARLLKTDYKTMYSKLKSYQISSATFMKGYQKRADGEVAPDMTDIGEAHHG
jgi:DNA-binding NtrC family response regulator